MPGPLATASDEFARKIHRIEYKPTQVERISNETFAASTLEEQTKIVDVEMIEASHKVEIETQTSLYTITKSLVKLNGVLDPNEATVFPESIRFNGAPTEYQHKLQWSLLAISRTTNFNNAINNTLPEIPMEFLVYTLGPKPFLGTRRSLNPSIRFAIRILGIADPDIRQQKVQNLINTAINPSLIEKSMPKLDRSRFTVTCTDTRTRIEGYTPSKTLGRFLDPEPQSDDTVTQQGHNFLPHSADIATVLCLMALGYRTQRWCNRRQKTDEPFPLVETKDLVMVHKHLEKAAEDISAPDNLNGKAHTRPRTKKRNEHPDDSYTPGNAKRRNQQQIPPVVVPRPVPTDSQGLEGLQNQPTPDEAEHKATHDGANITQNSAATRPSLIDTPEPSMQPHDQPENRPNTILEKVKGRTSRLTTALPTPRRVTRGAQATSMPVVEIPARQQTHHKPGTDQEPIGFMTSHLSREVQNEIHTSTIVSKPANDITTVNLGSIQQTKDQWEHESGYTFPPLYQVRKMRSGQTHTTHDKPRKILDALKGGKLIDVAIRSTATPHPPNEHQQIGSKSYASFAMHVKDTGLETQLPLANALFLSAEGSASEWLPLPTPLKMTISVPLSSTESTDRKPAVVILTKQWDTSIPTTDGVKSITLTELCPGQSLTLHGGLDYMHLTQKLSFRHVSVDWAAERNITQQIEKWATIRPPSAEAKYSDIAITSDWWINQIHLHPDQKQIIRKVANLDNLQ